MTDIPQQLKKFGKVAEFTQTESSVSLTITGFSGKMADTAQILSMLSAEFPGWKAGPMNTDKGICKITILKKD